MGYILCSKLWKVCWFWNLAIFFEIVCSKHKEDTFLFRLAPFQHLSCLYSMKQGRRRRGGEKKKTAYSTEVWKLWWFRRLIFTFFISFFLVMMTARAGSQMTRNFVQSTLAKLKAWLSPRALSLAGCTTAFCGANTQHNRRKWHSCVTFAPALTWFLCYRWTQEKPAVSMIVYL